MARLLATGLKKVREMFRLQGAGLSGHAESWLTDEIQPMIMEQIKEKFNTQGGTSRWHSLAESTIEDRIRRGFGSGPILQRTGGLIEAVMNGVSGSGMGQIQRSRGMVRLVFNFSQVDNKWQISNPDRGGRPWHTAHQAAALQSGIGKPEQKLPPRPFLTLSNKDRIQIRTSYHGLVRKIMLLG